MVCYGLETKRIDQGQGKYYVETRNGGYSLGYLPSEYPFFITSNNSTGIYVDKIYKKNSSTTYSIIELKRNTNYSKGTTQYSDVTSTSKSTYPSNNRSGSYWYVYKGVY